MRVLLKSKGLFLLFAISFFANSCSPSPPRGHIIFLDGAPRSPAFSDLLVTDGDGNRLQRLGSLRNASSPTWSPDGSLIAVGCKEASICLLDANPIPDARSYPLRSKNLRLALEREIDLAESCPTDSGVSLIWSISWSPGGTELAVVCGTRREQHKVCIVSLEGNTKCWHFIEGYIYSAVWSPKEDQLALSVVTNREERIYLVDLAGQNAVYLTAGWSPEWSPDGERIAFIRWAEGWPVGTLTGLAVIRKDGSGFDWLYQPPISPGDQDWPESYLTLACEPDHCRLAWSPDGRYLAFSANHGSSLDMQIVRLDLKTKEIIFVTTHLSTYYVDPDWGP